MAAFNSKYDLPSFSKAAIPTKYMRVITKEFVPDDMWSSETGEPYLSLDAVHYIDERWTLQTQMLQALYLPQDHNADNIAEAFVAILENFRLDSAIPTCSIALMN